MSQADLAQVKLLKADPQTQRQKIGEAQELIPPSLEELYVLGRGVSPPPGGFTYRLWTVNAEGETCVGDFVPVNGDVVLHVAVDPSTIDRLLVTVEPLDSEPSQPGEPAWNAA
jgi:hypothetical protein